MLNLRKVHNEYEQFHSQQFETKLTLSRTNATKIFKVIQQNSRIFQSVIHKPVIIFDDNFSAYYHAASQYRVFNKITVCPNECVGYNQPRDNSDDDPDDR